MFLLYEAYAHQLLHFAKPRNYPMFITVPYDRDGSHSVFALDEPTFFIFLPVLKVCKNSVFTCCIFSHMHVN